MSGMAQRVGRDIALLFHDRGTRRGWVVSSTSRPLFTPGKDPVPIVQEAGWAPGPIWMDGRSRPHRDSIPDRLARCQSLYRLSYPTHNRNEYQDYFLVKKTCGCLRLTTYHHPVPLSWNLGTLTSWNPLGLSRSVTGLMYLYLYLFIVVFMNSYSLQHISWHLAKTFNINISNFCFVFCTRHPAFLRSLWSTLPVFVVELQLSRLNVCSSHVSAGLGLSSVSVRYV